jgi:hypothetical protein
MRQSVTDEMTDQRRALLTEREREILSGEADVTTNYRYSIESRVRSRLRERLPADIDLIREEYPEMFDELLYPAVCKPSTTAEAEETEETAEPVETPRDAPASTDDPEEDVDEGGLLPEEIGADVWAVVDEAAEGWDDDDRLEHRRQAAAHVLQYAVNTGEAVGKSHPAVAEARDRFPVESQNEETYWRKNIRDDVLAAVGTYSSGKHGYTVEGLP